MEMEYGEEHADEMSYVHVCDSETNTLILSLDINAKNHSNDYLYQPEEENCDNSCVSQSGEFVPENDEHEETESSQHSDHGNISPLMTCFKQEEHTIDDTEEETVGNSTCDASLMEEEAYDNNIQPFSHSARESKETMDREENLDHVAKGPVKHYKCTKCDHSSNTKGDLRKHQAKHATEATHRCTISGCKFVTKWPRNLKLHKQSHSNYRPYSCDNCEARFKRQEHLNKHILSRHTDEKAIKCNLCSFMCKRPYELKCHLPKHSDERNFACEYPDCEWKSKTKSDLTKHMRKHTFSREVCDLCGKVFSNKKYLKRHRDLHGETHLCRCEFCDRAFKRKSYMARHIRKFHLGIKPFKCEICDRLFSSKTNRTDHMKVHSEGRLFQCPICPYSALSADHLLAHIGAAHGETHVYFCELCRKPFRTYQLLRRHYQLKHTKRELDIFQIDPSDTAIFLTGLTFQNRPDDDKYNIENLNLKKEIKSSVKDRGKSRFPVTNIKIENDIENTTIMPLEYGMIPSSSQTDSDQVTNLDERPPEIKAIIGMYGTFRLPLGTKDFKFNLDRPGKRVRNWFGISRAKDNNIENSMKHSRKKTVKLESVNKETNRKSNFKNHVKTKVKIGMRKKKQKVLPSANSCKMSDIKRIDKNKKVNPKLGSRSSQLHKPSSQRLKTKTVGSKAKKFSDSRSSASVSQKSPKTNKVKANKLTREEATISQTHEYALNSDSGWKKHQYLENKTFCILKTENVKVICEDDVIIKNCFVKLVDINPSGAQSLGQEIETLPENPSSGCMKVTDEKSRKRKCSEGSDEIGDVTLAAVNKDHMGKKSFNQRAPSCMKNSLNKKLVSGSHENYDCHDVSEEVLQKPVNNDGHAKKGTSTKIKSKKKSVERKEIIREPPTDIDGRDSIACIPMEIDVHSTKKRGIELTQESTVKKFMTKTLNINDTDASNDYHVLLNRQIPAGPLLSKEKTLGAQSVSKNTTKNVKKKTLSKVFQEKNLKERTSNEKVVRTLKTFDKGDKKGTKKSKSKIKRTVLIKKGKGLVKKGKLAKKMKSGEKNKKSLLMIRLPTYLQKMKTAKDDSSEKKDSDDVRCMAKDFKRPEKSVSDMSKSLD